MYLAYTIAIESDTSIKATFQLFDTVFVARFVFGEYGENSYNFIIVFMYFLIRRIVLIEQYWHLFKWSDFL